MKKLNLYNLYLGIAIIFLIIISSISFYFVIREVASKKYINDEIYLSMFYNKYQEEQCKYTEWFERNREKRPEEEVKKCISDIKNTYFEKREFRYTFNMIKYWVLLAIMLWLLSIHTILFLIRKK